MNLNSFPIKAFLDAVDLVLNSNTFLLELKTDFGDIERTTLDVSQFIRSGEFKKQILEQDSIRKWNNYSFEREPDVKGNFFKQDFVIMMTEFSSESSMNYLRNMLTIELQESGFYSPYEKQLEKNKAQQLVVNFMDEMTLQMYWKMYQLNTDFSIPRDKIRNEKLMTYFEGDFGSDSATLIVREDNCAFMLLTNGRD